MNVPILDLGRTRRRIAAQLDERWRRILDQSSFILGPEELSLVDRRMQRVVEPGRFDVMAGTSSTTVLTAMLDVLAR